MTYLGDWGVLPHDAIPATATEDALVEHVAGEPSATAIWVDFKRKIDALVEFLRPSDWACSQDICLQTWYACILFDEAAPSMILANRKLFQAPATWVDLGH